MEGPPHLLVVAMECPRLSVGSICWKGEVEVVRPTNGAAALKLDGGVQVQLAVLVVLLADDEPLDDRLLQLLLDLSGGVISGYWALRPRQEESLAAQAELAAQCLVRRCPRLIRADLSTSHRNGLLLYLSTLSSPCGRLHLRFFLLRARSFEIGVPCGRLLGGLGLR